MIGLVVIIGATLAFTGSFENLQGAFKSNRSTTKSTSPSTSMTASSATIPAATITYVGSTDNLIYSSDCVHNNEIGKWKITNNIELELSQLPIVLKNDFVNNHILQGDYTLSISDSSSLSNKNLVTTSVSDLSEQHYMFTFSPTTLAAGTHYIYLTGDVNPGNIVMAPVYDYCNYYACAVIVDLTDKEMMLNSTLDSQWGSFHTNSGNIPAISGQNITLQSSSQTIVRQLEYTSC